jgi:hypothetical protein
MRPSELMQVSQFHSVHLRIAETNKNMGSPCRKGFKRSPPCNNER